MKKFKLIIIGLLLCIIPQIIGPLSVIQNTAAGKFLRGLSDGLSVGMMIIGVSIFAYGIACYPKIEKNKA